MLSPNPTTTTPTAVSHGTGLPPPDVDHRGLRNGPGRLPRIRRVAWHAVAPVRETPASPLPPDDGGTEPGGDGNEDPGSEADTLVRPDPPTRPDGRPREEPVPVIRPS
jgi:hypothetical protein